MKRNNVFFMIVSLISASILQARNITVEYQKTPKDVCKYRLSVRQVDDKNKEVADGFSVKKDLKAEAAGSHTFAKVPDDVRIRVSIQGLKKGEKACDKPGKAKSRYFKGEAKDKNLKDPDDF